MYSPNLILFTSMITNIRKNSFMTKEINKAVLQPRVLPAFVILCFCNHCNIKFDPIPVKVIRANLPKDHYVQVP